ncbi:MAG: hypothetical protein ABI411_21310, partial [Tahibacter sp.]
MAASLSDHVKKIKSILLTLPATGEQGFEGLIGALLYDITGVPFRLAASGLQFGVDGASTYVADRIYFEGKRYDGQIDRTQLITKIADLARRGVDGDVVWVLGATSSISAQLASDLRTDARHRGIGIVILDWSPYGIPPFVAALASGGASAERFLVTQLKNKSERDDMTASLAAVKADALFAAQAQRVLDDLKATAVATTFAQEANTRWLKGVFGSRTRARTWLG